MGTKKMFSLKTTLILWCILLRMSYASEPQCSPFHYQEQMLEKMIKLEMLVQKMKDDIDATQQRVLGVTERLDDDVNVLKSEWDTLIRNASAEIMKEYKESLKMSSVVFKARDLANNSPSSGERLVFTTTLMNEGQGYDNATGKFTAPVIGNYLLTAQFCVFGGSGKQIYYAFIVNGEFIKRGYFRNDSFSCFTADVITLLKPGAQLWLTVPSISTSFDQHGNYWNSFNGVLLHQWNSGSA